MADELDGLLGRVEDPALRADLRAHIDRLRAKRTFGLVFESHLPERVRLPEHPVRAGAKVAFRNDPASATYQVISARKGTATLRKVRHPDGSKLSAEESVATEDERHGVDALVVVADFGEPIYPGVRRLGSVDRGGDKPAHVVIKGENHHVLEALQFTHANKIDCIYIDPPYNLGGDLTYNDRRVARDDAFRHSKWLAFMDRRLRLAKDLLADTGIVLVAIDDTEQAHLRLLMDQIFGESNFIATLVWHGGRKNDARFVSSGHDYMLVYARSEPTLKDTGVLWRERKAGVVEALAVAASIWERHAGDDKAATAEWRRWLKEQKKLGVTTDAVNRFDILEPVTGRPINTYRDLGWPGGGGPRYDVVHPVTGRPVTVPIPGWRFQNPATMQARIDEGRVYFGPDEKTIPRGITYLDELDTQVAASVFEQDRKAVNAQLREILGDDRFKFPKDTRVLARWIDLVTCASPDAIVLDFFGGSGSTCQAVMELNASDGGRRQCILVTNNEVSEKQASQLTKDGHRDGDPEWEAWGIFNYVARPRIETVVSGVRADGSTYSNGMDESVEFVELTYQDPDDVELDLAFEAIAPLLWMRAGSSGPVIDACLDPAGRRKPYAWTEQYGVLFNADRWRGFVEKLPATATTAFVVTDSQATFAGIAAELPWYLDVVRLYENYLTTFRINEGLV